MSETTTYGPSNPAPPKVRKKAECCYCPYCGEEREKHFVRGEEWFACSQGHEDDDIRLIMDELYGKGKSFETTTKPM